MITVTKHWGDLPAAHRQHNHDGHCRFVHGHNWSFDITFACGWRDENEFVVDVGKLKEVKKALEFLFDHTLIINAEDPSLQGFRAQHERGLVDLRVVPNCGMEMLAAHVGAMVQGIINENDDFERRDVLVVQVVVWEDSKNSATWAR